MATIQIRNVPEEVHRIYRARASAAGQSLQEYLLGELIEGAALRDPREIVAEVEADLAANRSGFSRVSAAEIIRRDRESH